METGQKKVWKQPTQEKEKKKKVKNGQKLWLVMFAGLSCVFNYKMLLSYELWKLKTAKSCFQFP